MQVFQIVKDGVDLSYWDRGPMAVYSDKRQALQDEINYKKLFPNDDTKVVERKLI